MSGWSKSIQTAVALFVLAIAQVLAGCGGGAGGDSYSGPRGQVSGAVTLDGQPLQKGCQVLFTAEKGGYTAGGTVDDGGKYSLVYTGGKGLPVGEYLVQVSPPVAVSGDSGGASADPTQMAAKMQLKPGAQKAADTGPVPAKYKSAGTSGLKFKVEAGQNTADFKLDKQ